MLQVETSLDSSIFSICSIMLSDFKPLLFCELEWIIRSAFVLDHHIVDSYFWRVLENSFRYSTDEYSNSKKLYLHSSKHHTRTHTHTWRYIANASYSSIVACICSRKTLHRYTVVTRCVFKVTQSTRMSNEKSNKMYKNNSSQQTNIFVLCAYYFSVCQSAWY